MSRLALPAAGSQKLPACRVAVLSAAARVQLCQSHCDCAPCTHAWRRTAERQRQMSLQLAGERGHMHIWNTQWRAAHATSRMQFCGM